MSTIAEPQATPGIAGRYFVTERRMRFEKLTARVTMRNTTGLLVTLTLTNREILSPRRIARKLECRGWTANQIADAIFRVMQVWSLEGFPTRAPSGDPTVRAIGYPIRFGAVVGLQLHDGGQL